MYFMVYFGVVEKIRGISSYESDYINYMFFSIVHWDNTEFPVHGTCFSNSR